MQQVTGCRLEAPKPAIRPKLGHVASVVAELDEGETG